MPHYSFDIFDTCFIRSCGFANNVFDLLALEILGNNSPLSWLADFANIRIKGEEQARNEKQSEVTLEDIYNKCDFSGLTKSKNKDIAYKELEIEKKILVPVKYILDKIQKLHNNNQTVIFISDMYLPETFLKELLENNGFWKEGDKLYVSCSSGKTKANGSLFDLIAKENNYLFQEWHHWGDNKYSDYIIPRKKGIKSHLIEHKFTQYEQNIISNYYFGDNNINQRFAGIQKAIRLMLGESPEINLGCNIVIPTLVNFIFKIIEDARKCKVKQLFFLSRDGFLPYKITEEVKYLYPDIKISYINTSRSALYFPGAQSTEKKDILEVLGKLSGKKIKDVFIDKTNIDISQFIPCDLQNKIIESEKEGQKIIDLLYKDIAFIKILNKEYQEQNELVIKYFKQCGLANITDSNAIVDIRGTRKCHEIINRLLKKNGFMTVKGYYLEVTENRCMIKSAGNYFSIFYSERYKSCNNNMQSIGGLYSVIEQYFCTTGTLRTIKYKENVQNQIEPVYEEASDNEYAKSLCNIHIKIATIYLKYYIINQLHLYYNDLSQIVYSNLSAFGMYPSKQDLVPLTKIQANDDRFYYSTIVKSLTVKDLIARKISINSWARGSYIFTIYNMVGEKIGKYILQNFLSK